MVIEFTKSLYEKNIKNNEFVLLYFHAKWCGPCVTLKSIYENLSNQINNVIFGKIDVDDLRDISIKYSISSIPTIVLVKNGEPIWHSTGSVSEQFLKDAIKKNIK